MSRLAAGMYAINECDEPWMKLRAPEEKGAQNPKPLKRSLSASVCAQGAGLEPVISATNLNQRGSVPTGGEGGTGSGGGGGTGAENRCDWGMIAAGAPGRTQLRAIV